MMFLMALSEQHVTLAGRSLRYFDTGTGKPCVLIHAFPLSADLWQPQLAVPPEGWRLIAPDLRGFRGPGAPVCDVAPLGDLTMDDYVSDVVALLDHLGISSAVVGGISMGGYVAFALQRRAPERVRGLVLADTRSQADGDEARAKRREMLALIARDGVAGVADAMVPALVGRTTLRERPDTVAQVRRFVLANHPEALRAAVSAMMTRPDSTPLLPSIKRPALVVVGDEDAITPVADVRSMHEAIPGSRFSVLRAAGHLPNLEAPEAFSAALGGFLAESL